MDMTYTAPLALVIISGIFLALGALCGLVVAADIFIIHRKTFWANMMGVMIPVYIINATYLGPLAVYVYWKYGRPPAASSINDNEPNGDHRQEGKHTAGNAERQSSSSEEGDLEKGYVEGCHKQQKEQSNEISALAETTRCHSHVKPSCHASKDEPSQNHAAEETSHACHSHGQSRPFWATVLAGVLHCGAGCVLGDLVGEWLVYGTGAMINDHDIWPALLIDYAFALLFGIAFQYFSIAPMSGDWSAVTVLRAAKADVISLTSFEVGAFGWMVAYQVGIWDYKLGMGTWTYWWMMQVGMALGAATAFPVNWWLIKKRVKEPCC
ncbi:MAG: hypothetical protein M1831_003798 [Alyxoria varia]|nr:MAG: hypothetical protein M1831_003798 [Alyxoria varia]